MQYMGGKFRQSKAIVEVLRPYVTPDTVYVEPFCGGLNSAARVAKDLKPKRMMLNDANKSLVLMHEKCYHEGETAAKTPYDRMHKLVNRYCIKETTLGGGRFDEED